MSVDMTGLLFIDGRWVAPRIDARIPVINPATEEVFAEVAAAGPAEIDAAVAAARTAFDSHSWRKTTGAQRASILRNIAKGIRENQPKLARLEVMDNGKPLLEASADIDDSAACFDLYAALAEDLDRTRIENIAVSDSRFTSRAVQEPVGVAGAIIPWNYPLLMAAWKVAPALAAGCTMVLKPSELTPMTALQLGTIAADAGLPPGVLNIVPGYGHDAGVALAAHHGVDKIAFTGSGRTGSAIMAAAARDVRRVSLELGGKSPFLVFADADIEQAVEWIMVGSFFNQGQVCSATSRVFIHSNIFDAVLERLMVEAGKIAIGNGLESSTKIGPLISKPQLTKVQAFVDDARKRGAVVQCGGGVVPGAGYFMRPTILVDVPTDAPAWREEIFGPVVCLSRFRDESDAISRANDTEYGLAAAVMSADDDRCSRVAEALRAGVVWINCSQPTFLEAPWGGFKRSGIGRELGVWGLGNYLEVKQVTRYDSVAPWGWYLK